MARRDIVVIGASAGGIEAVSTVLRDLPKDLPASVFVVVHIARDSIGYLPKIFSKAGGLPAKNARHGEEFYRGHVYVAPADFHLIINSDMRIETIKGPRENRFRPAIDPLFRSAALAFGPRVVGVIMSGGLDDGTNGLRSIKMCGGVAVVQDPDDALVRSMPASALTHVSVDHAEPATRIGAVIERLVNEEASPPPQLASLAKKQLEFEVRAVHALAAADDIIQFGEPSLFTCPECHGALLSMQSERPRRYRCHTGHAFTTDSLISELSAATEDAIWNSIRSIQESAILLTHLAEHWRDKDAAVAREFEHQAATARQRAELVRKAADTHPQLSETKVANMARKAT